MEFGPYGITVNSYAPGVVVTDLGSSLLKSCIDSLSGLLMVLVDDCAETFVKLTEGMPGLGSQGGPEAYAKMVVL